MDTGRHLQLQGVSRLFGDTSFFFAALDPNDPNHEVAREISEEIRSSRLQVVTTWELVVECVTLLRYRLDFRASLLFLNQVPSVISILHTTEADRQAAIQFYRQRSAGRRLSLCDSLSYVIVSTRLNWIPCLSFDADFAAMGLTVVR